MEGYLDSLNEDILNIISQYLVNDVNTIMNLIRSYPIFDKIFNDNVFYYGMITDKYILKVFKEQIKIDASWLEKYSIYITLIQVQKTYRIKINDLKLGKSPSGGIHFTLTNAININYFNVPGIDFQDFQLRCLEWIQSTRTLLQIKIYKINEDNTFNLKMSWYDNTIEDNKHIYYKVTEEALSILVIRLIFNGVYMVNGSW